jgi:DMSO/TMAO reductase YedYZ molybdopterin-dependent catalytic subunit
MTTFSRGFRGRPSANAEKLPPGQYDIGDGFPVLSAGPTPTTDLDRWDFTVQGQVDAAARWTWQEFQALPHEDLTVDIHCVTSWSKFGTRWRGVSLDTLLAAVRTDAVHLTAFCDGGYTTNLDLADVTGARRGSSTPTTGSRWRPRTAGRCGCSSPTCTSGSRPSGAGAWR